VLADMAAASTGGILHLESLIGRNRADLACKGPPHKGGGQPKGLNHRISG
jgi:hypothetical protein